MDYRAIASALNDEGVPSPRNAEWAHIDPGAWAASAIRSILTNPMDVGDLVWNRRTDERFVEVSHGRATQRRSVVAPEDVATRVAGGLAGRRDRWLGTDLVECAGRGGVGEGSRRGSRLSRGEGRSGGGGDTGQASSCGGPLGSAGES
ncbi:recombinase family protein [Engelhardtia mirabilis]|uniref:Recombinase n=1 Tax=Engelhardtia mirabilis TaxID=2528011 RepID=A0A518BMJ7_9BACT|nr:Recombinase [Planctomycetes bacterium Pla133]QDV02534.1 Recombinase [Planctomycetes bacterium Pla86]